MFTQTTINPGAKYGSTEAGVARIRKTEESFTMHMVFVNAAERDQALALFPKYAKVVATFLTCFDFADQPMIKASVNLVANGVNGGVNETGLKRMKAIEKVIAKAGIPTDAK